MKKLTGWLGLGLLCSVAVSAASFEGKVDMKMTSDGKSQAISYQMKGGKIRVEMPGQKAMGGMIMDPAKRETTVIMDAQKMYMTMAMPDVAAMATGAKSENVKFEKTGEKETILGYSAEKYRVVDGDTTTEMWLAEGLGTFMMANAGNPMAGGRGGAPAPQGWEKALAGKELFPLRVVGKSKAGRETLRMDVTAIEKKTLPDALFTPPAGYQKLDMGGMMKGMMPGR